MRDINNNYWSAQTQEVREPVWTVALSMDDANNDVTYLTSSADCLDPFSGNILDYSGWVVGSSGSQTGFNHVGTAAENAIISGIGPDLSTEALWQGTEEIGGGSPTAGASGGFDTSLFSYDHASAYRYSVWVKRGNLTSGATYLGCSKTVTNNISGTPNSNPYFYNGDLPTINKWYLLVGILHGSGYSGADGGVSGVYDPDTGAKVLSGTEFKSLVGSANQYLRAYYFNADTAGDQQWFARPRVDLVDGTEPSLAELLGSEDRIDGSIDSISGQTQRIIPESAGHSIGSISIRLHDKSGLISDKLNTKFNAGEGIKGKRVVVYKGFKSLVNFTDYIKYLTYIVDGITYKDGFYTLQCSDINRSTKKTIFEIHQGTLTSDITADQLTIPITIPNASTKFPTFEHDNSYSDQPSLVRGYIKIDDEIISHSGWDGANNYLNVVQRGALNTLKFEHKNPSGTSDNEQNKKVEEYVYLEGPAVKLAYAILTGVLYGQSGTLPDHWHLGIDTDYVNLDGSYNSFENIGDDIWTPSDNTAGREARFTGLKKENGKEFIQKELMLWIGAYMPINADGQICLNRLGSVMPYVGYRYLLDDSLITGYGSLTYNQNSVINKMIINWNWLDNLGRYSKQTVLLDSESQSKHGVSDPKEYNFKGVFTGKHTDTDVRNYFDQIRNRFSSPPVTLQIDCVSAVDFIEVGDIIRVRTDHIKDYYSNLSVDRAFEVQQVKVNWKTGKITLSLFGGVEPATYSPYDTGLKMSDSYYTGSGVNLATYLSAYMTGNVVTTNCSITGNAASHKNAVYYYNGDFEIGSGVTVTIDNNVLIKVKGSTTINGTVTTKGLGAAGGLGGDPAISRYGFLGSGDRGELTDIDTATRPRTGGSIGSYWSGGYLMAPPWPYGAGALFPTSKPNIDANSLNILNPDGLSLVGIPDDIRGAGGTGGNCPRVQNTPYATGGDGSRGGGGVVWVTRGMSFGLSGAFDVSGADATDPSTSTTAGSVTVWGGTGEGGDAGHAIILIDGDSGDPSRNDFTANKGSNLTITADRYGFSFGQPPFTTGIVAGFESRDNYGEDQTAVNVVIRYLPKADNGFVNWWSGDEASQVPGGSYNDNREVSVPTDLVLDSSDSQLIVAADGGLVSRIYITWSYAGDTPDGFEIEYKLSADSDWIQSAAVGDSERLSYVSNVIDGESYDVRVRALSWSRFKSGWTTVTGHTVIGKTSPPDDVPWFQIDGKRLTWGAVTNIDLAGYEIRFQNGVNTSWWGGDKLHTGLITESPFIMPIDLTGSNAIMIKAIDRSGFESVNEAVIITNFGDPLISNVLATIDDHALGFTGTKTNATVEVGTGDLVSDTQTPMMWIADGAPMWVNYSGLMWATVQYAPVTYYREVNPIAAASGSEMVINQTIDADSYSIKYRPQSGSLLYTGDGAFMWGNPSDLLWRVSGDYQNWVGRLQVLNQPYDFLFTTTQSTIESRFSELSFVFDVDDIEEVISDHIVAASGNRLPLTKTFTAIKSVNLTLQDDGGSAVMVRVIDKNVTLNPLVECFNISNVSTSGTVDAIIKGY